MSTRHPNGLTERSLAKHVSAPDSPLVVVSCRQALGPGCEVRHRRYAAYLVMSSIRFNGMDSRPDMVERAPTPTCRRTSSRVAAHQMSREAFDRGTYSHSRGPAPQQAVHTDRVGRALSPMVSQGTRCRRTRTFPLAGQHAGPGRAVSLVEPPRGAVLGHRWRKGRRPRAGYGGRLSG